MFWTNLRYGLFVVLFGALLLSAVGCIRGPFTIKDEKFAASNACDGEGVLEFRTEDRNVTATARGDIKTFMRQSGLPSAWCHGFRHVWIGETTYEGYTFKSDPDDPLQFVVDRDKGYHYEQGKGTVTLPNGRVVTLP